MKLYKKQILAMAKALEEHERFSGYLSVEVQSTNLHRGTVVSVSHDEDRSGRISGMLDNGPTLLIASNGDTIDLGSRQNP